MGEPPGDSSPKTRPYRHKPGLGQTRFFRDDGSYFVTIKNLSDPESFKKVPTFLYSKALCHMVGVPEKSLVIDPLKSGDLLVKLKNDQQAQILLKAKKLHGTDYDIETQSAKSANYSKCKVFCNVWDNMTAASIKEGLEEYKCIEVARILKKTPSGPVNTNIYILSFATPFPPQEIYNGCYLSLIHI